MITLTIDGAEVAVPEGTTILDAAQQMGIYIPHLCSHPDLPPVEGLKPAEAVYQGSRRIDNTPGFEEYEGCRLCVVEIEGEQELKRACNTPVAAGMIVHTDTPKLQEFRRDRLASLLAKHPHACLTCAQREGCAREPCSMHLPLEERCCVKFGHCELQSVAEYVGIEEGTPRYRFEDLPVVGDEPLFERNYNLCIGCTRCVRACRDLRGVGALDFVFDEEGRVVVGTIAPTLKESGCKFCTACVEVCPTGALLDKVSFAEAQKEEALVPCRAACPIGIDVPRYVRLIAEGRYDQALAVVRERTPLPSVCSYICLQYCEAACRRGEVNEPVAIRALKRFVTDNFSWQEELEAPAPTGKRVAIVGSGPAGLTAGYYLARRGHEVTIFEASSAPGGTLRTAISKRRLPREALERDIDGILRMGVKLRLNAPKTSVDELFAEGFDAVFLATGSTFVGAPAFAGEIKLAPRGSIAVDPQTLATDREGVFAGGDAVLGEISEDFIQYQYTMEHGDEDRDFIDILTEQIVAHRGDASRSAVKAIAAGRRAASSIDRYLGGDGDIEERLVPPEEPSPQIGRDEGFATRPRLPEPYRPPPPQFAGLGGAGPPLGEGAAVEEAERCLRCDLRLRISAVTFPPKKRLWVEFNPENVGAVPEAEGVYQLLDEQENVIYIKGAMNLRRELEEQLEVHGEARYFMYEVEPMYTKRESELLQRYLQEHGRMPELNDELADLF